MRRYGVTVASYTWTMLHELVRARRPSRASATTRFACSSAPGCRAACGGASSVASRRPGCWSSTPRPRPARSSSTSARCQARGDGPPAARQPGGPARGLRHRRRTTRARRRWVRRASARPTRSGCCSRAQRARDAMATISLRGVFGRNDAWLATDRPVPPRRRWRLLAPGQRPRGDSHRGGAGLHGADPRRARRRLPPSTSRSPTASLTGAASSSRSRRSRWRPERSSRAPELTDALAGLPRGSAQRRAGGRPDPGHHLVPADHDLAPRARGSPARAPDSRSSIAVLAPTPTGVPLTARGPWPAHRSRGERLARMAFRRGATRPSRACGRGPCRPARRAGRARRARIRRGLHRRSRARRRRP